MTIHGPGTPIYASEIQAEFGGGNPFYISNYYAGGPYVPAGTVGAYGAIPASGAISLNHFYGASKANALVVGGDGFAIGYAQGAFGSLTPNTAWPFGAAVIQQIMWYADPFQLNLLVTGTPPNSGWTSVKIHNSTFTRASAFYTNNGTASTFWYWNGVASPFPAIGASAAVIFT